jgi:hypothetical protein
MTLRAILWRLLLIKLGVMRRRHQRCLARIFVLEQLAKPPGTAVETKIDLERILLYGGLYSSGYTQIMRNPYGFD